jgi:hypothetical protein
MGIAVGGLAQRLDDSGPPSAEVIAGTVAVAEVIFPTDVSGNQKFVETYLNGRTADETYSVDEVESLLGIIDDRAKRMTGIVFTDLDPQRRDDVLRAVGGASAYPDPDGTVPQRIRYYLINDLLFALYSSPAGGKLVGNENPIGHPGGRQAYQHGPDDE